MSNEIDLPQAGTARKIRHKIWKKLYNNYKLEDIDHHAKSKYHKKFIINTMNFINDSSYQINKSFINIFQSKKHRDLYNNIHISSKELKSLPPITDPESIEILKKLSQKSSYSSNYSPSWIELLPPEIVSKNAWKFDQLVCQPTKQHLTICSHCKYISKIQKELCPSTMNLSKIINKLSEDNHNTTIISPMSTTSTQNLTPNSEEYNTIINDLNLTREEKNKVINYTMEELENNEKIEEENWLSIKEYTINNIEKDIPRTFGLYQNNNKLSHLKLPSNLSNYTSNLNILLKLISRRNGYCQGLNFISASFLLQLNCLRASYITLLSLLYDHYNLNILYESKQSTLLDYLKLFENILLIHNKKIYLYFQEINLTPASYALGWFTTCFIVSSPGILSYCILDLLMSGLKDGLLKLGLAILDELEDEILIRDFEDLHNDFKELTNKINIMRLMRRVLAMKISENDVLHDFVSNNKTIEIDSIFNNKNSHDINTLNNFYSSNLKCNK